MCTLYKHNLEYIANNPRIELSRPIDLHIGNWCS